MKYRIHPHNKISKKYSLKRKASYLRQTEPPPIIYLDGRLDIAGIVYFAGGILFVLMTIVACIQIYKQRDNWWGLEIATAIIFLGSLAALFLRVGFHQYTKAVPNGKRLKHLNKLGKTTLKFTLKVLVIIGIVIAVCTLIYPLGYKTSEIYISNNEGSKYDFNLRLEDNDIWCITISEKAVDNSLLELECQRSMKKDLFTDVDYKIKYKTNKFLTERSGAVTLKYGKVLSIIQYGESK